MQKSGKPTSQDDLQAKIQETWSKLDPVALQKLVSRMPETCRAVVIAKGGATDEKQDVRAARKQMKDEGLIAESNQCLLLPLIM